MSLNDLRAKAQTDRNGFRTWDDMAVELEVAELLYALVRAAKPRLVVESGTGRGTASRFIAEALVENGQDGHLFTFEIHPVFREASEETLRGLPVTILPGLASSRPDLRPDMAFVDCVSDLRVTEIAYWLTRPDRPLVVVHDAHRPYPFELGDGVYIPGHDGVWIGRPPADTTGGTT